MAGFFGLFGKKTKYVDEPGSQIRSQDEPFFLADDEAKSLGNLNYMRNPKTIRRTFPKTASNQVTEVVKEVSSMEIKMATGGQVISNSISKSQQTPVKTSQSNGQSVRRTADQGMDLFRNMARELKK